MKEVLNPTSTLLEIEAPFVAKKAKPGQFIILRIDEKGERLPPVSYTHLFLVLKKILSTIILSYIQAIFNKEI